MLFFSCFENKKKRILLDLPISGKANGPGIFDVSLLL